MICLWPDKPLPNYCLAINNCTGIITQITGPLPLGTKEKIPGEQAPRDGFDACCLTSKRVSPDARMLLQERSLCVYFANSRSNP